MKWYQYIERKHDGEFWKSYTEVRQRDVAWKKDHSHMRERNVNGRGELDQEMKECQKRKVENICYISKTRSKLAFCMAVGFMNKVKNDTYWYFRHTLWYPIHHIQRKIKQHFSPFLCHFFEYISCKYLQWRSVLDTSTSNLAWPWNHSISEKSQIL